MEFSLVDDGRDPGRSGSRAMFVTAAFVPWLGLFLAIFDMFRHFSDVAIWPLVLVVAVPVSFILTIVASFRLYLSYESNKPRSFWWLATGLAAGPLVLVILEVVTRFDVYGFVRYLQAGGR